MIVQRQTLAEWPREELDADSKYRFCLDALIQTKIDLQQTQALAAMGLRTEDADYACDLIQIDIENLEDRAAHLGGMLFDRYCTDSKDNT